MPAERIEARSCVLAAGGFESNRQWLREVWGQNERGEWPSDNFLIRGTRFNDGVLLRRMIEHGADTIGARPTRPPGIASMNFSSGSSISRDTAAAAARSPRCTAAQ